MLAPFVLFPATAIKWLPLQHILHALVLDGMLELPVMV
jgi:hypothetical protein